MYLGIFLKKKTHSITQNILALFIPPFPYQFRSHRCHESFNAPRFEYLSFVKVAMSSCQASSSCSSGVKGAQRSSPLKGLMMTMWSRVVALESCTYADAYELPPLLGLFKSTKIGSV